MAKDDRTVVPLPLIERGSIEDAHSGFGAQISRNADLGRRAERAVSVLMAEIRGWDAVCAVLGPGRGGRLLRQAVDRALEQVQSLGPVETSLDDVPTRPSVVATFGGDDHAVRALLAAMALRDSLATGLHPSMKERFRASVGVNSGTIVDTDVSQGGIRYAAEGTTRMFAQRLQEFAGPDQVLVSAETYRAVPLRLDVAPIGGVRTNGDGETREAYCLRGLLTDVASRF